MFIHENIIIRYFGFTYLALNRIKHIDRFNIIISGAISYVLHSLQYFLAIFFVFNGITIILNNLHDAYSMLDLEGTVVTPDGTKQVRDKLSGAMTNPVSLGRALASRLESQGALTLLEPK